ncbi:hypothetical protein [Amycolatopsis sp. FDAARGOS 1241]|uniref:hypothetical protein n=1 Tax=Amycolatopsis sp. FDAARGOS 1241 TaxID=2778070 RepID=UPI00194F5366|nr:hypothetical protein [Amycolatopsis sp. FDAARGOS 1241]QRP50254.1 hypothetical protein I6J71_22715 [Amycolatopsis sp. FDAARGOS 1241]
MRPTIEDQLSGAQRLLDDVATDSGLSQDSRENLTNVRRLLTQIGRSWATLLPFYAQDNAALTRLLTRHGVPVADDEPAGYDLAAAATRNAELRAHLSHVITNLPPDGTAARREITEYLIRRIATDPS